MPAAPESRLGLGGDTIVGDGAIPIPYVCNNSVYVTVHSRRSDRSS